MPGEPRLELRGVEALDKALRELGPRVARRVGDRALRAAARPIVTAARAKAPRASGGLRRSIRARAPRRARSEDERTIPIGSRHPLAWIAEFGTGPRYHKSGKFVGQMPAAGFLRGAIDEQAGAAYSRLVEVLAEGIRREAAELSKGNK